MAKKMLIRSAVALVAAGAIISAPAADALQQAAATRLLLASVTDAQGRTFADLDADDVVVSENGEPREVVAVYDADYPVIVLVDNSSGAQGDLDTVRAAVTRFLTRLGQRFVALGTLADPPAMLTPLDAERTAVTASLERLTPSPSSVLQPLEAVSAAARAARENGSPFSGVVIVTAHGVDTAQPPSAAAMVREIFDSGAIVHVVSRTSPSGRSSAPSREADLLRDLADETRGNFTTVFSSASYGVALNNLADRLGTEMMVEYFAAGGTLPAGEVQVGVRIPGAKVRGLRVSK
jgi:hypothetical protein